MTHTLPAKTFGDLLKYLRKRAHLTQRDLAAVVGYTEAHLSRLENNERLPDVTTVAALFIPALDLKNDPAMMESLLKLAAQAREERAPSGIRINQVTIEHQVDVELGALEDVPAEFANYVSRPAMVDRIRAALKNDRCVALCGMAGVGKTALAATVARAAPSVFWHTLTEGVTTSAESITRQLALFLLAQGQEQVKPLVEPRKDSNLMAVDQQLMLLRDALACQPALLCFEDVHLLLKDETSLSLLRHLISTTNAAILFTSRVEVPLPVTQINVGGLEQDEARDLVRRLGLDLEAGALTRLLSRTDCSPMLLKLVAGQLHGAGANIDTFLKHLEMQPQVASYLLNTVLHDLSPAAHWLAWLLSVFRQPIDLYDDVLVELIQAEQIQGLHNAISELRSRYLVENARHVRLHPLVGDFLYASLGADASRKKRLHRLAADWSERAAGDIVEAAHHWTRAGDLGQASEVISDQSEALFQRGQAQAAVEVVDEALERISRKRGDTTILRRRLLTARGDLLRGTFRTAQAEASYREALSLAQNQPTVRAQIVRNLGLIMLQRGQTAEALRLCQSVMSELSPADIILRARVAAVESRAHLSLSHFNEAERIAAEAIALADTFAESLPLVADDIYARCERTLGWVSYTRHPEGDESLRHYRRALECARRAGLRSAECAVLSNTATALMERGDISGASQAYEEAMRGYVALGDLYGQAGILHNLGALYGGNEEYENSLRYFEKASEIEQQLGDREGLLSSDGARASILMGLRRWEEARVILENAILQGRESTDTWTMGTCLCLSTEVRLLLGELEAARASAKQVLSMPGIEDNARIRIWAKSGLALTHIAAGELDAAQAEVSDPPAEDLGFELTARLLLVQSAVALTMGDLSGAHRLAQMVLDDAKAKKLKLLVCTSESLMTNPPPAVADLPRLILGGGV